MDGPQIQIKPNPIISNKSTPIHTKPNKLYQTTTNQTLTNHTKLNQNHTKPNHIKTHQTVPSHTEGLILKNLG